MQSKITLKRILLIVAFAGFALSLALIFYFVLRNPVKSEPKLLIKSTITFPKKEISTFGLPVRLKIPVINVDAAIDYVGLTSDGAMAVTKSQDNVMWFEFGQRPGDNGSAVIAGHYGWRSGRGSVFDNLYKLRKGDKLYIEDDRGAIISFAVRESRRYDPNADASDVFESNDGKSHLNLITCEGVLDKSSETYSIRLVVFTDKE